MSHDDEEGDLPFSTDTVLVHFSGTWHGAEKDCVRTAIDDVEPIGSAESLSGYTWICTKVDVEGTSHFFASRIKSCLVFRSCSADALARRIRDQWG